MYAQHFGLTELPFCNTPDPRYFLATPDHEEALASLIYAVQERKGFVLLTGEVGAGKTLVSRMMLRHFEDRISSAVIHHSVCDAQDLLHAIATEFQLPLAADSSSAVVRRLHDFLLERYAQDTPVVLVVDEAQNLPQAAFEQLRMIGNLEADRAKLLQICFVGQPELQDVIRSPGMRQLAQRIFRCFHLPPLNRDLTEGYISHRLKVAGGGDGDIFEMRALDRIFLHSRGIPRVINTICDNALLSAYSVGMTKVDVELLDSVVPFGGPPASALGAGIRRDATVERPPAMPYAGAPGAEWGRGSAKSALTAFESYMGQAESTLQRIDRACEMVNARDHRVQQIGKALDGTAALLGPLAERFDEMNSHLSTQLMRAESAAARLAGLISRTKRTGVRGDELGDEQPDSHTQAQSASILRHRDAQRTQVLAGMADAVANLRRAAQQLSTGQLPNLIRAG